MLAKSNSKHHPNACSLCTLIAFRTLLNLFTSIFPKHPIVAQLVTLNTRLHEHPSALLFPWKSNLNTVVTGSEP